MEVWKIMFLSKWLISRFHVNLPGCSLFRNSRVTKTKAFSSSNATGQPIRFPDSSSAKVVIRAIVVNDYDMT